MTAPAWALGYDVAELKECADLYKKVNGMFVFGAFGLLKERDIATALASGNLVAIPSRTAPKLLAIYRRAESQSAHHDFTGRIYPLQRGVGHVSALAHIDAKALRKFLVKLPVSSWVEIFEEDRLVRRALEVAGFSYLFTKIMAGSEIKGVYCSGDTRKYPRLERADEVTLSTIVPEFLSASDMRKVRKELDSVSDAFVQHYAVYNKHHSWTALSLRGFSDDPGFIVKPAEMSASWKKEHSEEMRAECRDTRLFDLCPTVRAIVARLGNTERVRFMRLAPGNGELSRHADITDRNAGTANGKIARFHIPIKTNDGVLFQAWSARGDLIEKTFYEGCLFYLDQRKPHRVVNNGSDERIHLVIDVKSSAAVRGMLESAR